MNVWTCNLSKIEFKKIKTVNASKEEKETEQWTIRITPGNEFCSATDKVNVYFPNTNSAICNNKSLREAVLKASGKDSFDDIPFDEVITVNNEDLDDSWKKFHTDHAWDEDAARPIGTMGVIFDTIAINANNPQQQFCVWDKETNTPLLNKHGLPIISNVREVSTFCIWMPSADGKKAWTSMIGTANLEDALRKEMEMILSRGELKPLGTAPANAEKAEETDANDGDE